jgi:hypothetical protein
MNRTKGHDFTVHVGITLPEEAVTRIERAIQQAVLREIADTDLARGYAVALRAPRGEDDAPDLEPPPLGIWIEPTEPLGDGIL